MTQTIRNIAETIRSASHREGGLAKPIEKYTAKLPSDTFLWLGWGSVVLALTMWVAGRRTAASFVGLWAPTFLIHGVYNKLAKQLDHDKSEGRAT